MRVSSAKLKRATMGFVIVFLAVQLTVPAVALFGPRPARFAWQMYSGTRTQASFHIVRDDGATDEVVFSDYLGHPRIEMNLIETLPAHICEVESNAVAVRIDPPGSNEPSEVPCSP